MCPGHLRQVAPPFLWPATAFLFLSFLDGAAKEKLDLRAFQKEAALWQK